VTNVVIAQSADQRLAVLVRDIGLTVTAALPVADMHTLEKSLARTADVLIVDVRGRGTIPIEVSVLKRRYPKIGVLLVADQLDPAIMLEAMRAGVTEVVAEPVTAADLQAGIERLVGLFVPKPSGEVLGFIGAKGGVGTTTIAVSVATALAMASKSPVILVDLHLVCYGDAALLAGIEPRFSVADALENVARLDEAFLRGLVTRSKHGVDVLAAPPRPSTRSHDNERIRTLLHRLTDLYRWVVLDVPQSDLSIIDALEPMAAMTLVVNQELPSVRLGAELAGLLRQRYGSQKLGMVVNRFDAGADIGSNDVQKALGLPVWAMLPADYRRAVEMVNRGEPLVTDNNKVSAVLKQFANRFATATRSDQDQTSTGRKFNKLAGLF
jgi:pilus assembly protein CpaE